MNSNKLFSFDVVFQFLGSYYRPGQPSKVQSIHQNGFLKVTVDFELTFKR